MDGHGMGHDHSTVWRSTVDVLDRARELSQRGVEFALATVVLCQGPSSGRRAARDRHAHGQLFGWIGGACAEPVVIRHAQRVIAERS